ncbi:MAG: DUF1801 domain-containing protein [Thermoflexibacter sp.]|jgi:uncharacterized protein YdhG (YjbR/CyaY superfamily)|nr:DUF1801 domain-containing protein [Thermoflexibacter sp.]
MKIEADSVEEYLEKIPEERKQAMNKLRQTILESLPEGFEEQLIYGMIGYVVPKSTYPKGYHTTPHLPLPFVNIASQKNAITLYHMGIFGSQALLEWFKNEYPKHSPTKLDMGKSCIHFKKTEHIPYKLIAELMKKITVSQWIEMYEENLRK